MSILMMILGIIFSLIMSTFGGINSKAADTERQTDIKALHAQVEVYYVDSGYYPTLANMNDEAWLSANMKGLSKEVLKDPDGSSYKLSSNPGANVYSYDVRTTEDQPCNNTTQECAKYVLTATLKDKTTYTKANLN